ncbi:MAG: hypothetical protein EBR82_07360 [Caulobacteraceae bacterium]|nr:hypothetical protein [Caulobacteraceae bacterium]
MIWTREHDRVLAELEGIKVILGENIPPGTNDPHADWEWGADYPDRGELYYLFVKDGLTYWRLIDNYNMEIADAIRAAEAWVGQDPENRFYDIERRLRESSDKKFTVTLGEVNFDDATRWVGKSDDLAEAIAAALYEAVQ